LVLITTMKKLCNIAYIMIIFMIFYGWAVSYVTGEERIDSHYKESPHDEPIHITSDRMESNSKLKWIEFVGHVRATQKDTVITANRLKIFYESGSFSSSNKNRPEKIVATGRVKISMGTRKAEAEMVVYNVDSDTLVLSGNPRVWIGKNMISGQEITLFRSEERSLVMGGKKTRVKAEIFPGSKDITER